MFEPADLPALETTKFPSPVKVCILSSPDVVTVPPVASTKGGPKSPTLLSFVYNQPFVESI